MNTLVPITVIVSGGVVAKGRPRMTRRGFAYTPAATRKYEAHARLAAQLAMGDRPPLQGPVRVELLIELPAPASWSHKRRLAALAGLILPTSRPDLDNYIKSALDAINTIIVNDDSQIVDMHARKKFSGRPKLIVTVFPLGSVQSTEPWRSGVDCARWNAGGAAMTKKHSLNFDPTAPSEVEIAAARAIPDLPADCDLSWTVDQLIRAIWSADLLLWQTLYTIDDDGSIHLRGGSMKTPADRIAIIVQTRAILTTAASFETYPELDVTKILALCRQALEDALREEFAL